MFKFPECKTVCYLLSPQTGRYEKQPMRIPFNKLPHELKIEPTQKDFLKQQGANEIITGRIKNGKREFFTGLVPIFNSTIWYYGNDFEFVKGQKKLSLIVFEFSIDNSRLTVYYFNHFYKDSREQRIEFVNAFANHIKHKENP